MLQNYWKFPNRNVQTFGFVYHDTDGQNHWSSMGRPSRSSWAEICMVTFLQNCYGKEQFEKILLKYGWEKVSELGMFIRWPRRKTILVCVCDKIGRIKQNINPMWKVLNKEVDFGRTNIFPRSCILGVNLKTMWNKQRYCWQLQNHVLIQNFRMSNWKKKTCFENIRISSWSYDMEGHGQEMCATILCVGKQDDSTTLQSINSMHW